MATAPQALPPPGPTSSEDRIKATLRTLARAAATLAGAVLFAFLAGVLALRYVVFPQIDGYRADISASLSRASGMAVTLGDVAAGWQGLRPVLSLAGVRLADRRGRAVFELERAEITLSWWTLFAGDLRFHDVDLYGPRLSLRRGADGLIYLADIPLSAKAAGEEGALAAWLLGQPRLAIHDASLEWRDELAGAPEVELRHVEIAVRREAGRHHAALVATPPAAIADKFDLRADLKLSRKGEAWHASGTLYAETGWADLAQLRSHVPVPEALRSAVGGVRAWLEIEPGRVREATVDVNLRGVRAQLADDALPLDLETLAGRAFYRQREGGFSAGTRDLAFRTREGLAVRAADFSVSVGQEAGRPPGGEIRVNGVDLKIAVALLDYLPVSRQSKAHASRLAPRGQLHDSSIVWTGETLATASAFRLKARFENLGVNAGDGFPGLTGLSGTVEGDERRGQLRVESRGALFEAPGIFRAPLALERLAARATWERDATGMEVRIEEAHLANADAEVSVTGTYRTLPDSARRSPGRVALAGTVARARAAAVANYLPDGIAETREWLGRSVLSGDVSRGRFELKGDLQDFPFRDPGAGRFLVVAAIDDGRLRYHPAWPSVDRVRGDIRFENARLEIRAREAEIYASRVRSARAVISDLGANPPVLRIEGEIDTTGVDSARFLRETPLVEGPGAFTRAVAIEGPARLKLDLSWPLWGEEPFRLAGEYAFAGATASVGRSLLLSGIHGPLAFTEKSVHAPELTGSMFGQPATLRLSSLPDGSVLTRLDGRMDAATLGAFIPPSFARRIAGATQWSARVVSDAAGSELRVESTLRGLAIGLPEPFAKLANESQALTVTIRGLGTANEQAVAALHGGIHARIGRGAASSWHAALKFGSPVGNEPMREGLWLYGDLARFDLDAWREALATPASSPAAATPGALEMRGIELRFAKLRYAGRSFERLSASLRHEAHVWRGTLESPEVAGEVRIDPRDRGRVEARLSRFSLGRASAGDEGPEPAPAQEQEDLPALDIVADRFEFRGRWLGRLVLLASPDGKDWRIDRLDIANDHARFASSGAWRRTATGPLTTLDIRLDTTDLHALLAQFGYGEFVTRGEANLEGQLVWPGYPYEFSPGMLSGRFGVRAAKGQFAKIEPGAGKLLGLISLQSLPRRVSFDFRDIFSEGFAFDRISGEAKLARGILLTQDFEITGPSAFVSMAGELSLPLETQSLTVKVVPEVGESVAIAATLLGTPVMGLTTLLLQKLLQNPLGKVVSYEYLVTGSWDNPAVTRIGAAPATRQAPAVAPAPARPQ